MKRNIKTVIAAVICILGIVIMIGSAGALELDQITFTRGMIQMLLGLAMFAGAAAYAGC